MRGILNYLFTGNLIGLLYSRRRFGRFSIIPYKNTYLRIHKSCKATGIGRLMLGVQWESGRFMPSQMVMRPNSKIKLNGKFRVYSPHSIWINQNASLILGSGFINNNLNLSCFERVEIGNNVSISENVTIRDSDNHSINSAKKRNLSK